ncbi:acetate--CoA ligase family protein [Pararoseomonas indoligenes]|uniref:Acetate--CoA ligase family protein n=1 Tax=Roseomonas indoligenes TaxID=2820811 RepID=A0A940MZJ0_9PROT|nr:acetate--CoA ligase family protein [Pararoseomonas indoligenes]MBP0495066.1 acetate--CoA ligase family protein [Pararoseomonas indoligenes]
MPDAPFPPAVADLSAFLEPASVAIIGASADPGKIGARPLRYLRKFGFAGAIHPVNPRGGEIGGLTCHRDVADIPGPVDLAIVVTAAEHVMAALRACAAKGVRGAVVISAGFGETGEAGRAAEAEMAGFAARGMRVLGPNNQGTVNLITGAVMGFNPLLEWVERFRPGRIGLVSQSSGIGFGLLGLGLERGMGFAHLVTTGNEADLSFADSALALLEREEVRVVAGALEGVKDVAALRRLAERSHALGKPVVVMKGATSRAGGRAAASHTGSLAGGSAVFSGFCRQHGLVEAAGMDELLDLAGAFTGLGLPRPGRRVAIATGTGGTAVLMADALERAGFEMPAPSAGTEAALRRTLPAIASFGNPIDMTTANLGNRSLFLETAQILGSDGGYDSLVTVVGPAVTKSGVDYARQIVAAAEAVPAVFVSWSAPDGEGQAMLRDAGIPVVPSPQRLAPLMASAAARAAFQDRGAPARPALPGREARLEKAQAILAGARGLQLAEHQAKALCALWDLPVTREILAPDAPAAVAAAERLGYPVALKLQSAEIGHKTEIGGVLLNLADATSVAEGTARLMEAARRHAPGAVIDGVLVQEMVRGAGEVIVGVVDDPSLGTAVMAGPGGILAEIVEDVAFRLVPFDTAEAARLRGETRLSRMTGGVRGGLAWDAEALDALLARVSVMADELRGLVSEIDLNPVIIRPQGEGAVIVDALVVRKS